nr:reverse transcriptase domain-containing protein [Tanacetum cinerariifolium]
KKSPQDALTIIENKSNVRNSQSKPIASPVNACDNHSSSELAKLTHAFNQQTSAVTTAMTAMLKQFQSNPPAAQTNAIKNMMASLLQMNTASTSRSGTLPGNTVAHPKGELKAITTRSGLVTNGPTIPNPSKSVNPEEDECVEETYTDPDHAEHTIKVPPPPSVQKPKPPIQRNALVLMPKYQKMLKALLSNKEKLQELANTPLNENCSAVILKKLPEKLGDPGKFLIPCGFSELKCKALADLAASINLMPLFDVYPDDFLEIESDAFDDNSFDSEGEKIKEAELLIDPLDLPCDILFEYDSFNSQDFSRDDVLPSPDNENKVFNSGILSHAKSIKIIIRVNQEKKLAVSFASLLFEDFDPTFYELLVFKEVPNSMRLLPFSSENEETIFKPGIYISKKFHCCFLPELSHQGFHVFKVNMIFLSLMKIFHVQSGKNTPPLDEKLLQEAQWAYLSTHPSKRLLFFCFDDDDEDYTSAITPDEPVLSTEELDNSLSMRDEHLDTISVMKSDEFIKSGVENLIPIPSESEGIPEHVCDVPSHDNSPPLDVSKDQIEDFSKSNKEFSSNDDDSFSIDDIDYVEESPPDSELVSSEVMEIVIPEVGGIDDDILLMIEHDDLHEKLRNVNLLISKIEALNVNPTPSSDCKTKSSSTSLNSLLEETHSFDNSLPEFETFCFDVEEISSGSTTTHPDIYLPKYEAFHDDHVKEFSSGSPTTHSDSPLYASFMFDLSINPFTPADRSDSYEFTDELIHFISAPDKRKSKLKKNKWIMLDIGRFSLAMMMMTTIITLQ